MVSSASMAWVRPSMSATMILVSLLGTFLRNSSSQFSLMVVSISILPSTKRFLSNAHGTCTESRTAPMSRRRADRMSSQMYPASFHRTIASSTLATPSSGNLASVSAMKSLLGHCLSVGSSSSNSGISKSMATRVRVESRRQVLPVGCGTWRWRWRGAGAARAEGRAGRAAAAEPMPATEAQVRREVAAILAEKSRQTGGSENVVRGVPRLRGVL
mmetsp:Transcript_45573/g.116587  ORF Transcript_45573/g.116587 Transcript_45573/m.116587 type:complete len:215 (-) Transcript_45573:90-734(-)